MQKLTVAVSDLEQKTQSNTLAVRYALAQNQGDISTKVPERAPIGFLKDRMC